MMAAQNAAFRRRIAALFQRYPGFATFAHDVYRLSQPKFTVGVVGVILNARGQILLVEHVFHAIPWGMPGGWIDRGEDPADCAPREIREELGMEVTLGDLILVRLTLRGVRHLDFAYLCHPQGDATVGALSPELLGYRWFDLDEVPPLVEFQRIVVEKLRRVRPQGALPSQNPSTV
jgi:8-oxo-dGTP pyrophosphatase MutT (NUDIX family)